MEPFVPESNTVLLFVTKEEHEILKKKVPTVWFYEYNRDNFLSICRKYRHCFVDNQAWILLHAVYKIELIVMPKHLKVMSFVFVKLPSLRLNDKI